MICAIKVIIFCQPIKYQIARVFQIVDFKFRILSSKFYNMYSMLCGMCFVIYYLFFILYNTSICQKFKKGKK